MINLANLERFKYLAHSRISMEEKVDVSLDRNHAILLFNIIKENFNSEGYEGAKTLLAMCQAFSDAIGEIEEEE